MDGTAVGVTVGDGTPLAEGDADEVAQAPTRSAMTRTTTVDLGTRQPYVAEAVPVQTMLAPGRFRDQDS
jgi:hypothetical protein